MHVRTPFRTAGLAVILLGSTAAFAAAPCVAGAKAYEGSRAAVKADQVLWQRSGMERLAKLAEYEPNDPAVVKARQEYERLRSSDAYDQEVARIAAARGETLSGFSDSRGCETPPMR